MTRTKRCSKIVWIPCDLSAMVKRLARLNDMTSSDLIRLSIEARLPDYEPDKHMLSNIDNKRLAKEKS
ncbi:MAG: hypothetical protein ABIJ53_00710 [Verrucomicrobiota bacterium]